MLMERPSLGDLIEVGTGGVTASGRFIFAREPDQSLSYVDVCLRDQHARFHMPAGAEASISA